MNSPEIPRLLLDQHFSDLDAYSRQIDWDIEFRQLDAGVPRARAALMGTSRCIVMRGEYDRAYHHSGQIPTGMLTIGLPDPESGDFRWCGKQVSGGQIANFSLESGFDGVCGAGFSGFAVSFREDLLQETLEKLELNVDVLRAFRSSEFWSWSDEVSENLRRHLNTAYRAMSPYDSDVTELFNFSAAAMILNFLAKNQIQASPPPLSARRRAVSIAVEYLEDEDKFPLTVSELCAKTGVSAPTLYRAFHEEYGVSPKHYIQIRRLCGVRQHLHLADHKESIANIANRWGFWHMGQFAFDYRKMFGELPSETLKKHN